MCLCQTVTNSSGGETRREAKKSKEKNFTGCVNVIITESQVMENFKNWEH